MADRSYHHGNLRAAALAAALDALGENGPAALSLRDVARRAGVSHAALAHHFDGKRGLLTAVAAEGHELLADELAAAGGDLVETGVAYVRFAAAHRAHFEVMFRPDLHDTDDPHLRAGQARAGSALTAVLPASATETEELAAWSIVHGFAQLWVSGALPFQPDDDAGDAARPVIRLLTFTG